MVDKLVKMINILLGIVQTNVSFIHSFQFESPVVNITTTFVDKNPWFTFTKISYRVPSPSIFFQFEAEHCPESQPQFNHFDDPCVFPLHFCNECQNGTSKSNVA